MKTVKIGDDISASKLSYGCMRIGNKSESEAEAAVKTALQCGINFLIMQIFIATENQRSFSEKQYQIQTEVKFIFSLSAV